MGWEKSFVMLSSMFWTREVESAAIDDFFCASKSSSSILETGVASAPAAPSSGRLRFDSEAVAIARKGTGK